VGLKNVTPEKRSRLSLLVQEYWAIAGDLDQSGQTERLMAGLRQDMEKLGCTLHYDHAPAESITREDMNAKELLLRKLNEAGEPGQFPGATSPARPSMPRRGPPSRRPPSGAAGADEDDLGQVLDGPVLRMTGGGAEAPRGQFSPKEVSQLKDVLILTLAAAAGSTMDLQIAHALMFGEVIEPGLLQHILDEARNAQIPDSHGALLQKIHNQLQA
jgi:hypothetical protein